MDFLSFLGLAGFDALSPVSSKEIGGGIDQIKDALKRLDDKGLKASDVQGHIDPDNVNKLADKMRSGEFKNELMDQPVIRQGDVQLSGHHRTVAAEVTGFPLDVKNVPEGTAGAMDGQSWSDLPLDPGRRD